MGEAHSVVHKMEQALSRNSNEEPARDQGDECIKYIL
jgi:hypothetical protein